MPPLAEKKAQRLKQIAQLNTKAENLKLQTKENDIDLKRALGRKPDHLDPFVQESPTSSNKRSKNKGPDSGRTTGNLGTLPYWGVSVGTGLVVGGPVAWGLAIEDAHCLDHGAQGKRGTCAVGMGVVVSTGVHGYCTAAVMGSCKSHDSCQQHTDIPRCRGQVSASSALVLFQVDAWLAPVWVAVRISRPSM